MKKKWLKVCLDIQKCAITALDRELSTNYIIELIDNFYLELDSLRSSVHTTYK